MISINKLCYLIQSIDFRIQVIEYQNNKGKRKAFLHNGKAKQEAKRSGEKEEISPRVKKCIFMDNFVIF